MSRPRLDLRNLQRETPVSLRTVRRILDAALPLCLQRPGPDAPRTLGGLREIACALVSSRRIARIHAAFLGDPSPTDVITFPYGEIVVCPGIAADRAPAFGHTTETETALYCIHGLLHLNGYDDTSPPAARRIRARQRAILAVASASEAIETQTR